MVVPPAGTAPRHPGDTLKADPSAQLALLDVQSLDARADQLRHRRAGLAELAEIAALESERRDVDGRAIDARTQVSDLAADQAKIDADVESVRARRDRNTQRMDAGLVTSPKDLQGMQAEIVSLDRRITSLEDEELEVMAQVEDAQRELDVLTTRIAEIDDRLAGLTATRDARFAEIDAELAAVAAERSPAAAGLPEDLVALYDRLRAQKGGVGAAELRARQCGGCRLTLDFSEVEQIRLSSPDTVVRCEECQRILVRTAESGL